jgi:nitrite reductase/ring-hydroxylating ferredoxin subunit/uncharacterized membrane protein
MRQLHLLESLADRIERADALDPVADAIVSAARKVLRKGPVEDALSGTPLGHPLHPLLVAIPIGAWVSSAVFDGTGNADGARRLIGLGCLAALPAAASGANDWTTTTGAERRVGLVHAALNDSALTAYWLSWRVRRQGKQAKGVALSLVGAGLLGVAGWLGGHLAYAQGVGVDTTAFQQLPQDWTDAGAESDVPTAGIGQLVADGVPLLVARRGGTIVAMLDRCTHRGGPLSDGEISGDCVVCPWHGSKFALADGSVMGGPATRPQPMLEVRTQEGRIEVRRSEPRTLRTNPVGT